MRNRVFKMLAQPVLRCATVVRNLPPRPVGRARLRVALVFVVLSSVFLAAVPSHATFPYSRHSLVASVHDFTDDGFTGGGVCAGCHVPHGAQNDRLYPRDPSQSCGTFSYSDAPRLQCLDCHCDADGDGWGAMPTGGSWSGYTGNQPPAPGEHPFDEAGDSTCASSDAGQIDCSTHCHQHADAFLARPCLDCHTPSAAGPPLGDLGLAGATDVDSLFDEIGNVTSGAADDLLSQHSMDYQVSSTAGRREGPDLIECKHCHGLTHPSDGDLLRTPDEASPPALGTAITRACGGGGQDMSAYQDFCISCHSGLDANPSFPVPWPWISAEYTRWNTRFAGPVPASPQQVGPSDQTDPATQQSGPTWVVPAVPPRDVNAPFFATETPFFAYYESNGHGRATGIEGAMDVTCLAGGIGQGCHVSHGSQNRFLVDDFLFGTGVDTATEFAGDASGNGVCFGCHDRTELGDPDRAILSQNMFHTLLGNGVPMHDKDPDAGTAQWNAGTYSMNIASSFTDPNGGGTEPDTYAATQILPFYADPTARIEARAYVPTLDSDWIMCLSCHDPHGTSTNYWRAVGAADDTGTANTRGMLRKFPLPTAWDYNDPLCWECHSQ